MLGFLFCPRPARMSQKDGLIVGVATQKNLGGKQQ